MSEEIAIPDQKQIFRVALASIVGSVIEQYDFLVTGVVAATVWGGVFFKLPGLAAAAAAIAVYGLGIIIRPIGALIFGHIADRHGRREAMVYALVLMGGATLLIGLTPTYDSIGVVAPALLILFRLLQGISFGAEFGTASTWVVEQAARSKYRAFWGAWVGFAIPIGLLLGFGSVILVRSLMTAEHYNAWGWRIFFFVGFLVAIVGLIIRMRTIYVEWKMSSGCLRCSLPQACVGQLHAPQKARVFASGCRQSSARSNPGSSLFDLCRGLAVKSGDIPQCGKQPVKLDRITVDGGPFIRAERHFLEKPCQ